MAGVCSYCCIRTLVHVSAITQLDENGDAAGGDCSCLCRVIRNGGPADVAGKKVLSDIVELCMETGIIESLPAE